MSLLGNELAKLTITAYKDREGKIPAGEISTLFNPDSLQLEYQSHYVASESINKTVQNNRYVSTQPAGLNLTLLFDAWMPGNTASVDQQLGILKALCATDATTEAPYFLKITWGNMRWENKGYFAGRATSLTVNYSLFDRDATPLRATAQLSLVADESFVIQEAERQLEAPANTLVNVGDVTTAALVAATIAAMTAQTISYLDLAFENELDHLDDLNPGDVLSTVILGAK